jgi:transmembrane sensor
MKDDADSTSGRDPADLEAAGWLIRHDRGLTAAEQDDFLQWLAADPSHQEWFARHRQTWTDFNLLAQWRPEHAADPNPDLLARPRRRRRLVWACSGTMAFAASLAVAWFYTPSRTGASAREFPSEIKATAYEHRMLEDGSIVDLNRGAHLAVRFTPGERRVALLQGEARFTVATNAARPFIVRAGGIDVRAVGTDFNVRLDREAVDVLVTEGKVQLDRSPQAPAAAEPATPGARTVPWQPSLVAGQRMIVPLAVDAPTPAVLTVSAEVIRRLLAWKPLLLDFNSTPLGEVVAEFNRRNRTQMTVADDELLNLPIVASFRSDNLQGFVRLLELTANIRAEHEGESVIMLRKKDAVRQP